MIGYVTLGVNDLEKAAKFYETVLGEAGAKRMWANERMVAFGRDPRTPSVIITKPYDGQKAYHGNGTMVALAVGSTGDVARVYEKAIALGAQDEGAPGYRGPEAQGFYGAYFRDPDGNKFATFCMSPKK
ncbi:MAG: VOC family protein [Alphaproteobacteria bacterium]|nr:VOC family protein [Alphaproteobacteria bacterium]